MTIELHGRQVGALVDALGSVFRDYARLKFFTLIELDLRLADISPEKPMPEVLAALIEWADIHGRVDELIAATIGKTPNNPKLNAIASELLLTSPRIEKSDLESIVLKNVPTMDVLKWRDEMVRLENGICRLETANGEAVGSGFLIADDIVLTNRHVADQLMQTDEAGSFVARFAVKTDIRGQISKGEAVTLAYDWLVGSSPVADLDYAFIRLATAVDRPTLPPPQPYEFKSGDILLILHHPQGASLKVSAGCFANLTKDRKRVSYTVNTERGSSGSPVFTMDWRHVALHHAGGHALNSGIPLSAINADSGSSKVWQ